VNVYPFIEAERQRSQQKARGGNVARACELLKVSRSAYYAQRRRQRRRQGRRRHRPGPAERGPARTHHRVRFASSELAPLVGSKVGLLVGV
jgi:hypothetical protein